MRLASALVAALWLTTLAAEEPLDVLRKTAATYKNAKSYKLEGADILEQTVRGKVRITERRFQAYYLASAGMRVDFADGGMRLTDGHFEWNYNQQTKQYAKKPVPWDSRGSRIFNQFFYNYGGIADSVKSAGFLGPPGKELLIEVTYQFPGNIEENRTYAIDAERYIILREISYPAPIVEPPTAGPVKLVRTVTMHNVALNPALSPSLFGPPPNEAGLSGAAPDFRLDDLAGVPVGLHDLHGKAVLLYFWATWCATCREEMPKIEKLARDYHDRGLVVLGVNDEEPEIASAYLRTSGHTLRSLVDRWHNVHKRYAIDSIPTVVLIARDGRIVSVSGFGEEAALRAGFEKAGLGTL